MQSRGQGGRAAPRPPCVSIPEHDVKGGSPPCSMPAGVSGGGNDKIQFQFQLNEDHMRLRMQAAGTTWSMHDVDSAAAIQPGVWTHVGFTFNSNFRVNVYLDGQLDGDRNTRMPRFEIPALNHVITIGPGRPGAVKRPERFAMKIHFVWGFCMGARGA